MSGWGIRVTRLEFASFTDAMAALEAISAAEDVKIVRRAHGEESVVFANGETIEFRVKVKSGGGRASRDPHRR